MKYIWRDLDRIFIGMSYKKTGKKLNMSKNKSLGYTTELV